MHAVHNGTSFLDQRIAGSVPRRQSCENSDAIDFSVSEMGRNSGGFFETAG
jgi:hypothetical protein